MSQRTNASADTGAPDSKVEGEAKGRVEGSRRVLLQLLGSKFDDVPAAALQRLEAAGEEQLVRFTTLVLDADTLSAVLAD
jgi:hypothetical protein